MGIGEDIKSAVDGVRNDLGSACTLNAGTALGKCSFAAVDYNELTNIVRDEDELGYEWAMIEVTAGFSVKAQDKITVTATGDVWIVRRVTDTMASGVRIAQRCYCFREML